MLKSFVDKQHLGIRIPTSSFDGLIRALIDDAVKLPLSLKGIIEQLIISRVLFSGMQANQPLGVEALVLNFNQTF